MLPASYRASIKMTKTLKV
ncbi:hypothetical protein E2C01_097487 [Portunus trituberculatus]|uniref:Uncharacterized protein n=1 Tax=Portunus trituberculatus TaxID=210409 RepID=A0A5B7K5T6_PORTR|nr:hypothetical protein [Portunus trituberculatus]